MNALQANHQPTGVRRPLGGLAANQIDADRVSGDGQLVNPNPSTRRSRAQRWRARVAVVHAAYITVAWLKPVADRATWHCNTFLVLLQKKVWSPG